MGTCFCWASRIPETVSADVRADAVRLNLWVPPRVETQEERAARLGPAQSSTGGLQPVRDGPRPSPAKPPPPGWALGPALARFHRPGCSRWRPAARG